MSTILNMAYPTPFLRVVWSGSHFLSERFSFGVSLINDFGTGEAPTEVPAAIKTATDAFFTSAVGIATKCDTIKVNLIGVDGKYVNEQTVLYEYDSPQTHNNANRFPPQVAVAVSLETGARRGLAARGRFYVPNPISIMDDNGLLTDAGALSLRDAAVTLLSGVEDALPGWDLGVVSDVGAGRQRAVTGVRVGRVFDTIRSRRAQLDEQYTDTAPFAPDV
jgi:hypothetical protein